MQKSVQARKNRIISAMSGQFQSELPIFKMNGSIINKDLRKVKMNTFSITYYGKIRKTIDCENLANTMKIIFGMCDRQVTHWANGITGKNTGKVKCFKNNKFFRDAVQNEKLEYISFFSLPEDYRIASFDYAIYISVNYKRNYITAVFEEELIEKLNIETLRKLLGSYMELPYKEETYTMDKEETPLLYAAKMNPISSFKTLEIISNTTVIE